MSIHSDYLLREISNLLRLGEAEEQGQVIITSLKIQTESLVHTQGLGVWYFHDAEVEALTVNSDGFNLPAIEDVITKQKFDTKTIEF